MTISVKKVRSYIIQTVWWQNYDQIKILKNGILLQEGRVY